MMCLIGIAGQARMGKDTLGASLRRALPELRHRSFATAVKRLLAETFDVDLDFIEAWKVRPETPPGFDVPMRQALQTVGDGLRTIRASVWVDTALADGADGVFTDVRYANEAQALRARGGVMIVVGRTQALSNDPNPSERSLRPLIAWLLENTTAACVRISELVDAPEDAESFDWFVRNDGTVAELDAAVETILAGVGGGNVSCSPLARDVPTRALPSLFCSPEP